QFLARRIESPELFGLLLAEFFVAGFVSPIIDGAVSARLCQVTQQFGLEILRRAAKELRPSALRPIEALKLSFAAGLNLEDPHLGEGPGTLWHGDERYHPRAKPPR